MAPVNYKSIFKYFHSICKCLLTTFAFEYEHQNFFGDSIGVVPLHELKKVEVSHQNLLMFIFEKLVRSMAQELFFFLHSE